ncbi:NUDIX domain-containing protein [Lagierella sp.]|uniref:8-oxo-dGTP diphosphatase n=1 Tax=Lagierella sp. TaxID=2849657 RepID=UPI0026153133|nr:NUDIX domain-containing protein [Lagierella sp.]
MEIVLLNMCMIYDPKTEKVLVLDKPIKEGWEGLTFPGGHVEKVESLYDSCVREIKEETNLDVFDLKLKGIVQWYEKSTDIRLLSHLYYTENFCGELIDSCNEGRLFWMDLKEFIDVKEKSASMDEMLQVYLGKSQEVVFYFTDNNSEGVKFF